MHSTRAIDHFVQRVRSLLLGTVGGWSRKDGPVKKRARRKSQEGEHLQKSLKNVGEPSDEHGTATAETA